MVSDKRIGDWRSPTTFNAEHSIGGSIFLPDDVREEMSSNKRRKLNAEVESQGETL